MTNPQSVCVDGCLLHQRSSERQGQPRLILVIAPFAQLVGYDELLSRPAARLLLPLAIFLAYSYAWGYLPHKLVGEGVYATLLEALRR